MSDTLYEQDFFIWTQRQAEELRRAAGQGSNLPLDWGNLAEEIESLGRRERSELRRFLELILAHLIKLAASPAEFPRPGWKEEVEYFRLEVERALEDMPSLRPELDHLVRSAWRGGVHHATKKLREHGEYDLAAPTLALWKEPFLTADQILEEDSFPERGANRMTKPS